MDYEDTEYAAYDTKLSLDFDRLEAYANVDLAKDLHDWLVERHAAAGCETEDTFTALQLAVVRILTNLVGRS